MKTETNQPAEVPTPRTRAFTDKMRAEYFPHALGGTPYIKAVAFARKLERENIALLELLKPFAAGSIDVSETAVILGYGEMAKALKAAIAAIKSATEEVKP